MRSENAWRFIYIVSNERHLSAVCCQFHPCMWYESVCFWQSCLPDGVMSAYLTRLMRTAEGHNTSELAGDSRTVAVVSLCMLSAHSKTSGYCRLLSLLMSQFSYTAICINIYSILALMQCHPKGRYFNVMQYSSKR